MHKRIIHNTLNIYQGSKHIQFVFHVDLKCWVVKDLPVHQIINNLSNIKATKRWVEHLICTKTRNYNKNYWLKHVYIYALCWSNNLACLKRPIVTREHVFIFSTALDQLIGVSLCVTEYLRCGQTRPPVQLILVVNSNRRNVNTVTVNRAVQICFNSVLQYWLAEDDNLLVIWEGGDRYTLRPTVWEENSQDSKVSDSKCVTGILRDHNLCSVTGQI